MSFRAGGYIVKVPDQCPKCVLTCFWSLSKDHHPFVPWYKVEICLHIGTPPLNYMKVHDTILKLRWKSKVPPPKIHILDKILFKKGSNKAN